MYKETQSFLLRGQHTDKCLRVQGLKSRCSWARTDLKSCIMMHDWTTRIRWILLVYCMSSSVCTTENAGKEIEQCHISSLQNSLSSHRLCRQCAGWQESLDLGTWNLLSHHGIKVSPRNSMQVFAVFCHQGCEWNNKSATWKTALGKM